ncbi:MAG: hypothetical protein WA579_03470, partial [Rhodomicrobium sp.]
RKRYKANSVTFVCVTNLASAAEGIAVFPEITTESVRDPLTRISHQGDDGERLCSNRAFSGLCWRSIDAIKRRFGRTGV